jgi:predicted NUDIX family phosphoesterase
MTTNTIKVWIPDYNMSAVDLSKLDNPETFEYLNFYNMDMTDCGYVHVGSANVVCNFFNQAEIQNNAVDALKKEIQEVRAKAEKKATELQEKINRLLAITNEA